MVETHVLNVFLDAQYEGSGWRGQLSFFNGLVAPAFLWIAGYIQGRSIRRSYEMGRAVAPAARWQRLGLVLGLGLFLHVPWHLWLAGDFGPESWRIFLQMDILPCLALSLALLLGLGCLRQPAFDAGTLALLVIFVFGAPLTSSWSSGFPVVDGLFNRGSGSLFPLFPWFGFCAAGSLASRWELKWPGLLAVAGVLLALGYVLEPAEFSSAHPAFFSERLGLLLLGVLGVQRMARYFAPAWLQLAGRESLLIYVSHLVLLHSVPAGAGLTWDRYVGQTLSPFTSGFLFLAVLGFCLALAWEKERRKKNRERRNHRTAT
jgi:hypothetical protein